VVFAASSAVEIFKGAKPADLPVETAESFLRMGSVAGAAAYIIQLVGEFERVQRALAQECPQLRGTSITF
jgi:hypothetical protein